MPRPSPEARRASHRANQAWHFKKRARQRFGLVLTDADVAEILRRIQEDKPGVVFLAMRERSSAWRVKWRGITLVAIYDHHNECLVTCFSFKKWRWD